VLAQQATITENRHRWCVAMAEVHAAAGDIGKAGQMLDRAEALYRRGFYPEIRPIPAMRARLAIAAGYVVSAFEWSRSRGVSVGDDPDYLREYEHLTLVRLLLAEARAAPRSHPSSAGTSLAVAALPLLERLHAAAAETGREGSLIEVRMLQALTHDACGHERSAMDALARAVAATPEPDSYVRLYLDEGTPMLDLLQRALSARGVTLPQRLSQHLDVSSAHAGGGPAQQPLADPLSHRELDVLRLLDSELTGPDIARQLYVSLNTLRTHTKRIFTKLDVSNRAAAVRRAHQLGLL
jgi:LuxR family maltose regulon positive regulatory protein